MNKPGYKTKPFYIELDSHSFNQKSITEALTNVELEITKVYRFNLWRRALYFFGIPFRMFDCKIKEI